jgi:hypothetical protein
MIRASVGLVAAVLGASACATNTRDTGDGGGGAAASVWNASVTVLEFHTVGGFPPPPPPGSQCAYREARYRLTVGTRTLEAARCESDTTQPYQLVTQSVLLSEDQLNQLAPVLSNLTPIGAVECPLDAASLTLQVTTATGVTEYAYCGDHPPLISLEHLTTAMTALRQLAGSTQ